MLTVGGKDYSHLFTNNEIEMDSVIFHRICPVCGKPMWWTELTLENGNKVCGTVCRNCRNIEASSPEEKERLLTTVMESK